MAERSTAAVDVANESGRPPLDAEAGGATDDGANGQGGTQDATASEPERDDEKTEGSAPPRTTTPKSEQPDEADQPDPTKDAEAPEAPEVSGASGASGASERTALIPPPEQPDQSDRATEAEKEKAGKPDKAERAEGPQPSEKPKKPQPPEPHSGHKLARRYRLEECVTRRDGFSSWRAVDEKLRRAVGVQLLPAGHDRSRAVLSAARSAALLGDPRFVQVLDAVEEDDLVYVVHEWLPDATELTALLANGPLAAHDAYQLVSQVSQAMSAAHREGLSHLCLDPSAVLRSESGQYRIRGLAVDAALRGTASERPKRTDTEAIGALLYAALTARWPYHEDAFGLTGLPKNLPLVAPDKVRAGVHRGLADLAMRSLVNDGATPSRQEQPCTTPEELAKAVAALPRIRPPEPEAPTFTQTVYRQPPARPVPPAATRTMPVAAAPPPALPGRTGKVLKWGVAALLLAALGLGSWQVADTLMNHGNPGASNVHPQKGSGGTVTVSSKPLPISSAQEFSPFAAPIQASEISNAVDGNLKTAWVTKGYQGYPNFGNLPERREGGGIIVDLGSVQQVGAVTVTLYRPGQTVEVLAAGPAANAPTALADFRQRLTTLQTVGGTIHQELSHPIRTRYVLVHITALPPDTTPSWYRGGISEIQVFGVS